MKMSFHMSMVDVYHVLSVFQYMLNKQQQVVLFFPIVSKFIDVRAVVKKHNFHVNQRKLNMFHSVL
jgi:hypothetical protein